MIAPIWFTGWRSGKGRSPPQPPLGLNSGHWLAAPRQSPYATARQWITANPGYAPRPLLDHLCRHIGKRTFWSEYRPSKHCPQCAKAWYHTMLFEAAWLERCPIHGERLIANCPYCGLAWPAVPELKERHCEVCGNPPWHALPEQGLSIDAIAPLIQLEAFLDEPTASGSGACRELIFVGMEGANAWDSLDRAPWQRVIHRGSKWYPSFKLHHSRRYDQQNLEALGVLVAPFNLIEIDVTLDEFNLGAITDSMLHRLEQVGAPSGAGRLRSPSESALVSILECLGQIVPCIQRLGGAQHRLQLLDFRGKSVSDYYDSGERPCPLCFAFSAWWDAVTEKLFDPTLCSTPGHYWITQDLNCPQWPTVSAEQLFVSSKHSIFRLGAAFESHFYQRGLLLLFAYLVDLAVFLNQRMDANTLETFDPWDLCNHFQQPEYAASYYQHYHVKRSNQMRTLWADVNPLDEISVSSCSHHIATADQSNWVPINGAATALEYLLQRIDASDPIDIADFREIMLEIGRGFHIERDSLGRRPRSWLKHDWGILAQTDSLPNGLAYHVYGRTGGPYVPIGSRRPCRG